MKLSHKVPLAAYRSESVTPEYQAEVDRSTNKAMLAYERAQRRLEAAEERLRKAERAIDAARSRKSAKALARERAVAAELVELRREELQKIEALMKAAPASAEHRGTRSYRPIPKPGSQV